MQLRHILTGLCLLLCWQTTHAQVAPAQPRVVLIIDDMGYSEALGQRALRLPGNVTYSFLPFTPAAVTLANAAHNDGKEVMLHAPMTAERHNRLGPGALAPEMNLQEFQTTTRHIIDAVPYVRGVNNHMGSELTALPEPMHWLMTELRQRNLYFVDSRTNPFTVAQKVAALDGLPHLRRDVFLDHEDDPADIRRQFALLVQRARQQGLAVGIGHPRPHTLAVLEQSLPTLKTEGIQLVFASRAAQRGYGPLLTQLTHDVFPTSQ